MQKIGEMTCSDLMHSGLAVHIGITSTVAPTVAHYWHGEHNTIIVEQTEQFGPES